MLHKFNKRPTTGHRKRKSVSFSKAEVGNICFNDDVEITLYDDQLQIGKYNYSGFVFVNSLVLKKASNGDEFFVFKL